MKNKTLRVKGVNAHNGKRGWLIGSKSVGMCSRIKWDGSCKKEFILNTNWVEDIEAVS